MTKNKNLVLKITLIMFFVIFTTILWVFIANLDNQVILKYKTYQPTESYSEFSQWHYRWGDSPLDDKGNFQWLDSSASEEGWTEFMFPGRPENPEKYNTVWMKTKLPHVPGNDPVYFKFRASQQSVEAYLDHQLIYKYGEFNTSEKIRTIGSTWHFVQLPADYAGKTMYLRTSTPFTHYAGYLTQIAIGDMGSHYIDIFKENIAYVIFGFLFIFTGFAILIARFFGPREWSSMKYLAMASVFLGCWYISDTSIIQIFIDLPVSMIYATNYFIFLTPVWLLIFLEQKLPKEHSTIRLILRIQWILYIVFALAAFTMDIANLVSSLYYDLVFIYFMTATTMFIIYLFIFAARKGRKDEMMLLSGILLLGLTGLADSHNMYFDTSPKVTIFRISFIGMLYFLITLFICLIREFKNIYDSLKSISRENETNYKSLFANMTDGFIYGQLDYSQDGEITGCTILEVNDAFVLETGKQKEELIGTDLFTLYPAIKSRALHCALKCAGISSESVSDASEEIAAATSLSRPKSDASNQDDILKLKDKWYRISTFCPKYGSINIILSDISEIKKAEETIKHQAYTDRMTGFFSRTYFEEILSGMNSMMSIVKPLSIIAIDIDGLKITNDTFGHEAGDNLIKKAAHILTEVFGEDTPISRIGGDEFCVVLPCTDFAAAQKYAEQIVKLTEASNNANPVIPISMSVGIATSDDESNEDIYSVYRRADDDMYRYKMSQTSSEKSKVIDMLLTALSEKDYVSQGHVERISQLCLLLANAIKMHENQKRDLVLLSKVHDLGKIGIPDEILNKPAKLTPKEYERMKLHVKIGYNIASRSRELVTIAPLILHHHEHWDGKGYPDSLKGEEIPIECRILSIADAFDAMTNDRPYHKGISAEEALAEIEKCAGTQFDPVLARIFVMEMRGLTLEKNGSAVKNN